jgi:hypothetical protein
MTHGEERAGTSGAESPDLTEAAARAAAPQLTTASLDARFGPRSSWAPAPGQLWRVVHGDLTALVVLLAVDVDAVTAAPMTVEPVQRTSDVVALGEDATSLGVPSTVWPRLARTLPMSVLDRPIDDLGAALATRLRDQVDGTDGSAEAEHPLVVDAVAAAVAADLDDDLTALAAVADAEAAPTAAPDAAPAIDIASVKPADLHVVVTRLGVGLPVVLDLIDGKRSATPEQAVILREVLGGVPATQPPPPGLVLEWRKPQWRGLVRQRSRRDQLPEEAARAALTQESFTLAARQTGEREPSWADRIQRWADAHDLDPDADA